MNPCADAASVQRLRGIAPNRWVASRHFASQSQHRVCVWNELAHTFTVFEHEDAQLWVYIADHPRTSVQALAAASGRPVDEVDTWVGTHMQTHLLCYSDAPPPASCITHTTPGQDASSDPAQAASQSASALRSQAAEAVFQTWAMQEGYRWSARWDLSKTPTQDKSTLSELKNQGVFQLRLEDRELALRPALFGALHEARQLGFSITITTHGLQLNSVDLELIIAAYPHCVEVDGSVDAQHTIRYLSKAGVRVMATPPTGS